MDTPTPLLIDEQEIVRRLAISRPDLRELRKKMRPKIDWFQKKRRIVFTEAGVAALASFLNSAVEPLLLEKKEPAPILVKLAVVKIPINPRIVICFPADLSAEKKEGAATLICRVRSSAHFIPKMVLTARLAAENVYELVGRCPRWKGRW